MKKLITPKLSNWFSSIDSLFKAHDKVAKAQLSSSVSSDFQSDSTLLAAINNVFLETVYQFYHQSDDKCSTDVTQTVCSYLIKLFGFPERKITLIAIDILPSFLFGYLCICFTSVREPSAPRRQRSRRRSSISPFNDSKKCTFHSMENLSVIEILECCLLSLYNTELDTDVLCRSSENDFRFPCMIDASIYSNTIFHLQNSAIESLSHGSYSHSTTSLIPNMANVGIATFHSNNSLEICKSVENGSSMDILTNTKDCIVSVTAENRCRLMKYFFDVYRDNITDMSQQSLLAMMKLICQVHPERQQIVIPPRTGRKATNIQLSRLPSLTEEIYIEMTLIAYHALYGGIVNRAMDAINSLEARANLELASEVLLITNAIKNSMKSNPVKQAEDGPLGLNTNESEYVLTSFLSFNECTSMSPVDSMYSSQYINDEPVHNDSEHPSVVTSPTKPKLKSIITNASFRTIKLPDDIPIVENDGSQNSFSSVNSNSFMKHPEGKGSAMKFSLKPSKTPRFKFDFKNSEKFEGIKECVTQDQCSTTTPTNHSVFFGKSRKIVEEESRNGTQKSEDAKNPTVS